MSFIVCDECGIEVPVHMFPAHCIVCSHRAFTTISQSFTIDILSDSSETFTFDEQEMMQHKIVKRLKDVDQAAPRPKTRPKENNCCVCLEPIPSDYRRTTCNHEFCSQCIEKWFDENTTCPVCKNDFSESCDYELIDTQTMGAVNSNIDGPIVDSIMRRLGIIGDILDSVGI